MAASMYRQADRTAVGVSSPLAKFDAMAANKPISMRPEFLGKFVTYTPESTPSHGYSSSPGMGS